MYYGNILIFLGCENQDRSKCFSLEHISKHLSSQHPLEVGTISKDKANLPKSCPTRISFRAEIPGAAVFTYIHTYTPIGQGYISVLFNNSVFIYRSPRVHLYTTGAVKTRVLSPHEVVCIIPRASSQTSCSISQ